MPSEMDRMREIHRRRRRKRLIAAMLIVPLLAVACALLLNLLLRVRNIVTENPTIYSGSEILSRLSFDLGDGMFSFDRDKLCRQLETECPFIKKAQVTYRLPNTVHLTLTAAVPLLAVQVENGYLCLDGDFKVLSFSETLPSLDILLVTGMDIAEYTVGTLLNEEKNIESESLLELISLLQEKGLYENVCSVDLSRKYNITMIYNEVIIVSLGNMENLDRKINLFQKILCENEPSVPAEISVRDYTTGRYRRL